MLLAGFGGLHLILDQFGGAGGGGGGGSIVSFGSFLLFVVGESHLSAYVNRMLGLFDDDEAVEPDPLDYEGADNGESPPPAGGPDSPIDGDDDGSDGRDLPLGLLKKVGGALAGIGLLVLIHSRTGASSPRFWPLSALSSASEPCRCWPNSAVSRRSSAARS